MLCAAAPAAAKMLGNGADATHVQPKLEPASHKVFYKHDYPVDLSPKPLHDFSHPFPIVQDSEDYDKDFVKDENNDGGEWKVQEEYDRLRGRLAQARDIAAKMEDKEYAKAHQLREAEAAERAARAKSAAALKAKTDAEARAAKKLKAAEGKYDEAMSKKVGRYGVANQTTDVEKEIKDMEDCQKELTEARKKLKELQEERDRAEAVLDKTKASEQSADDQAMSDEKVEASAEGVVADDESKYKVAHQKYEKEHAEMLSTQAEFKKAEARLRKFRQKAVDPDGGVYQKVEDQPVLPTKSSALQCTMSLTATLIALAVPAARFVAVGAI